jgi:serine/threonine-protein kinase
MLKRDWFLGLIVSLAFAAATLYGVPFLQNMERLAYDTGVKLTPSDAAATKEIAIVAIDDDSIDEIGRWPWPRKILADMITQLSEAGAKVIGLQIFLSEPQTDPGLTYFRELREFVGRTEFPPEAVPQVFKIKEFINRVEQDLDADNRLAEAIPDAGNVLMPMFFNVQVPLGNPDADLPEFIQRNRLSKIVIRPDVNGTPRETDKIELAPLAVFGNQTAGIGHLNLFPDVDGAIRKENLVLKHYEDYYPSLTLLLAARSLNLEAKDITVYLGESVKLGRLLINTDADMSMLTGFYSTEGNEEAFSIYSFHHVRAGTLDASAFKDKIVLIGPTAVLIGPTAKGVGSTRVTPVSSNMSDAELTANVIASIRNQHFYIEPEWTKSAVAGIFVAVALYLMFVLPNLGAALAAIVSLFLFLGLLGAEQYMLIDKKVWLQTVPPALLLLVGHVALTTKRFFATERQKKSVETDAAQTNRMLGLSCHGQVSPATGRQVSIRANVQSFARFRAQTSIQQGRVGLRLYP